MKQTTALSDLRDDYNSLVHGDPCKEATVDAMVLTPLRGPLP